MKLPNCDKVKTGANIKRLMRLNKIDSYKLAQMFDMRSTTSIYAWTQGRIAPNADNLVKLSKVFNCSIDDIVVVEGEE